MMVYTVNGLIVGRIPVIALPTLWAHIHLDQLSTTDNLIDEAPSTLPAVVGLRRHIFSDTATVRFERLEFKPLKDGHILELKITVRYSTGQLLNNHNLPISVVLEFQRVE